MFRRFYISADDYERLGGLRNREALQWTANTRNECLCKPGNVSVAKEFFRLRRDWAPRLGTILMHRDI